MSEESAVFTALLNDQFVPATDMSHLAIRETAGIDLWRKNESAQDLETAILGSPPDANDPLVQATEAMCQLNVKPTSLDKAFVQKLGAIFLTEHDYERCFNQSSVDARWTSFHADFPKAEYLITLSRVGFSKDGKTAMLYMGELGGNGNFGHGQFYLMRYINGQWVRSPRAFAPSWG